MESKTENKGIENKETHNIEMDFTTTELIDKIQSLDSETANEETVTISTNDSEKNPVPKEFSASAESAKAFEAQEYINTIKPIVDVSPLLLIKNTSTESGREQLLLDYTKFVILPCDPLTIIRKDSSSSSREKRWSVIQKTMKKLLNVIEQQAENLASGDFLIQCIQRYCTEARKYNFEVWKTFWEQNIVIFPMSRKIETLKIIAEAVIELPKHFSKEKRIQLLASESNSTITMSQEEIFIMLSAAFMCTYPKRGPQHEEYKSYPSINFLGLFHKDHERPTAPKVEKLYCLFNYFYQMGQREFENIGSHNVVFERHCLQDDDIPDWLNSNCRLSEVRATPTGSIFAEGKNKIQVNFANKYVGGGVIGNGAVMEEIFFSIHPELVISRLFTEKLNDNETLIISGSEQFSDFNGYGSSFEYDGVYIDNRSKENNRIVAIDAIKFNRSNSVEEFDIENILRELNKCYVAFRPPTAMTSIASGKWGCGVFNGDPLLKSLIQIMAASQASKAISLYTFGDNVLCYQIDNLFQQFLLNQMTVGKLFQFLSEFRSNKTFDNFTTLYDFLLCKLNANHISLNTTNVDASMDNYYCPSVSNNLSPSAIIGQSSIENACSEHSTGIVIIEQSDSPLNVTPAEEPLRFWLFEFIRSFVRKLVGNPQQK